MDNEGLISILELAEYYSNGKRQMEAKLPYHLNVIDELYINENGHSRILAKLLQYKNENRHYDMLESLITYIYEQMKKDSFGFIFFFRKSVFVLFQPCPRWASLCFS